MRFYCDKCAWSSYEKSCPTHDADFQRINFGHSPEEYDEDGFSKVPAFLKKTTPTPSSREERFEKEFFYRGEGSWGHYTDYYDEDDNLLNSDHRAYLVPDALKSFIKEVEREAYERGRHEYIKKLLDDFERELERLAYPNEG